MEEMKIAVLSAWGESYQNQASSILIESFYTMFRGISKDREVLRRLFAPCMKLDLFYVAVHNDRVAGLLAVSDANARAILIDPKVSCSLFGKMKGKIIAWQVNQIMGRPAVSGPKEGYIDFLATAPEYRKQGIARKLLGYAEENAEWTSLYLDVLESNAVAIHLYEKLGYQKIALKKSVLQRMAGIRGMYQMKKELLKEIE